MLHCQSQLFGKMAVSDEHKTDHNSLAASYGQTRAHAAAEPVVSCSRSDRSSSRWRAIGCQPDCLNVSAKLSIKNTERWRPPEHPMAIVTYFLPSCTNRGSKSNTIDRIAS